MDRCPTGQCLYVHVPFCTGKCSYCDFFSIPAGPRAATLAGEMLGFAGTELKLLIESGAVNPSLPVRTVFFGGGTPSLASAAAIGEFLRTVHALLAFDPCAEITLETQPATCDRAKLHELASAGITRFSVGVQSLRDARLRLSGRRHSVAEARTLLRDARAEGDLSADLICAWPGQGLGDWLDEIREVLAFAPDHVSVYELTYHPGTRLSREAGRDEASGARPPEDRRAAMFEATEGLLAANGFEHYEISNFALPGHRSRHNENYWQLGDYAGLGPGAHSFSCPARWANPESYAAWRRLIQSGRLARVPTPTPDATVFVVENLQMALRLVEGADMDWLATRLGADIRAIRPKAWRDLVAGGMIIEHGARARMSREGRMRLDSVCEYLL